MPKIRSLLGVGSSKKGTPSMAEKWYCSRTFLRITCWWFVHEQWVGLPKMDQRNSGVPPITSLFLWFLTSCAVFWRTNQDIAAYKVEGWHEQAKTQTESTENHYISFNILGDFMLRICHFLHHRMVLKMSFLPLGHKPFLETGNLLFPGFLWKERRGTAWEN